MKLLRASAQTSLAKGWQGYWEFDEQSGNATDSSGNGRTLTAVNAPTSGAGVVGNARILNGTNQAFTIASGSAGAFNPGSSSFFIRARVNAAGLPAAEKNIFSKNLTTGNQRGWVLFRTSAGILRFAVSSGGADSTSADSPLVMVTGTWYDIFAGVDHGSGRMWISADCEPPVYTAYPHGVVFACEAALAAGAGQSGGASRWEGSIDTFGFSLRTPSFSDMRRMHLARLMAFPEVGLES